MESDNMLEVRLIMKDGTCAVFGHVVGFESYTSGFIIYNDDKHTGKIIKWDAIKAVKIVKKIYLGGDIDEKK